MQAHTHYSLFKQETTVNMMKFITSLTGLIASDRTKIRSKAQIKAYEYLCFYYIYLKTTCMAPTITTLEECQLLVELDRLDNPEYFAQDFSCPILDSFFQGIYELQTIAKNKEFLNHFFDRLLDVSNFTKSLYSRMKWLLVLHKILRHYQQNDDILDYILKALELYLSYIKDIEKAFNPYEKYLTKMLFRPYIQYLIKYCQLLIIDDDDEDEGEDQNEDDNANQEKAKKRPPPLKSIATCKPDQWYREFNFLVWSIQVFDKPLKEVHSFFADSFPLLNQIQTRILKDITNCLRSLKLNFYKMPGIHQIVTVKEFKEVEQKIGVFQQNHGQFLSETLEIYHPLQKDEISEFMASPLKPVKNLLSTSPTLESNQ